MPEQPEPNERGFVPTPGQVQYAFAHAEALHRMDLPDDHPLRIAATAALNAAHDMMDQEYLARLEYERETRDAFLAEMGRDALIPVIALEEPEF